jgi:hypothetical protein
VSETRTAGLAGYLDSWRSAGRSARENYAGTLRRPHADAAGSGQYDLLWLVDECPQVSFRRLVADANWGAVAMSEAVASMA